MIKRRKDIDKDIESKKGSWLRIFRKEKKGKEKLLGCQEQANEIEVTHLKWTIENKLQQWAIMCILPRIIMQTCNLWRLPMDPTILLVNHLK